MAERRGEIEQVGGKEAQLKPKFIWLSFNGMQLCDSAVMCAETTIADMGVWIVFPWD